MHVDKTLFAQVMEFVPWTSFARIVQRHGGNAGVRSLTCAEQFRAMAFAQLTWRESLRDIEASLSANSTKLYAMGFRSAVKRSTLAAAALGQSHLERVASVNAQTLDDLPALVLRADDDETQLQACAGHYLGDAEAEKLLTTGLMPLLSHRRKSAVTLPRWQSIAEPLRALQGLSAA